MDLILHKSKIKEHHSEITITGSKSESNRLLLLQALYPEITILNVSNSDDSKVMQKAVTIHDGTIDIHHAGTAMRFLTAYFATKEGSSVILTGSNRMKERPIKVLVDALNDLGADISYLETEGCPPLKINGNKLTNYQTSLKANVSSQYISALLLVAPRLKKGLELTLEGDITSLPYIKMTLELLRQIGVESTFVENVVTVAPKEVLSEPKTLTVESDWSSASYFYSIVALSPIGTSITLSSYRSDSLQGDSILATIYKNFGVESTFHEASVTMKKVSECKSQTLNYDLKNAPDIAQTIAITCFGLGIGCHLTGLHTLLIKETDRLSALKIELEKLGGCVTITDNSLHLVAHQLFAQNDHSATWEGLEEVIFTYNDHRMAMAFAPLALKRSLVIQDAMVVTKSYPTFWDDLKAIGFEITQ